MEPITTLMALSYASTIIANGARLLQGNPLEDVPQALVALRGQVSEVSQKLDEKVFQEARASYNQLRDALSASKPESKKVALDAAYRGFTSLAALDSAGNTAGTSASVRNAVLIVAGHWGRCSCFVLLDDIHSAVREVYEASRRFPDIAVDVFAPGFYTRDYRAELKLLESRFRALKEGVPWARAAGATVLAGLPANLRLGLLMSERDTVLDAIATESRTCIEALDGDKRVAASA